MIDRTVVVAICGALALVVVVLEMVRRRRLKAEYSLLWLLIAGVLVILAGSRRVLADLALALGIAYPPSALIVVGFAALILAALHFSAVASRLGEENLRLAQEMAILKRQVEDLARSAEGR